eukprot:COSAG04_NODE_28443_length_275_cov_1.181818_1_plen_27_part_01
MHGAHMLRLEYEYHAQVPRRAVIVFDD